MQTKKLRQTKSRQMISYSIAVAVGLLLGHFTQEGVANRSAPTEHAGLGVEALGVVSEASLTKQLGLNGHIMQLREISIMPGGTIKKHSHATRPGLVLTVAGSVVEGRAAGEIEYPAGKLEAIIEDVNTEHWFFNDGNKPAKIVVCDIVPAST